MPKLIIQGLETSGTFNEASNILYNNDNTELSSNNVQNAITEVNSKLNSLKDLFYPIGAIVYGSTSDFDSEDKIKARYGGNKWVKIEGRMLLGADSSHSINSTGGSESHTITTGEMPSHSHTQQGTFTSGGQSANHYHGIPALSGTANTAGSHAHTVSDETHGWQIYQDYAGGSTYQFMNGRTILTGAGGLANAVYALTGGSHSHTVTTNASNTGWVSGDHTHNTTISGTTTATGSGTAMNIMNPYKAVYIWERTE